MFGESLELPFLFQLLTVGALGLVFGSFATAMVWRIPRNISWIYDKSRSGSAALRSKCTNCDTALTFFDLIPFFSWIFLKGRCRSCKAVVPLSYPMIELAVLVICVASLLIFGFSVKAFILIIATPFWVALFEIDRRHFILPDQLVVIVAVLGLGAAVTDFFQQDNIEILSDKVFGAVIYMAIIAVMGFVTGKLLKKEALGLGDVKLFFAVGMWLGLAGLPLYLLLSGFLGVIWGGIQTKFNKSQIFPFGPALILAFYICLFIQGHYMGLGFDDIFRL